MDLANVFFVLFVAFIVFVLILGLARWLWNSTLPSIFGIREITLWETFKILLLSAILFGGLRFPFGYTTSTPAPDGGQVTWTIGTVK